MNQSNLYPWNQCSGSVAFWIWMRIWILRSVPLTDLDPDSDADLYQNFQWFLGCKKINFCLFYALLMKFKSFKIVKICLMINWNFLQENIFVFKFCFVTIIQSAQDFYEKKEGFKGGSGSVLVTSRFGCGSGRPKNIRILRMQIGGWILEQKSRQNFYKFSSLLFTVTSAAFHWVFYFFKLSQPLTFLSRRP